MQGYEPEVAAPRRADLAPVWDFAPSEVDDPSEVDAFIEMIREVRHQDRSAGAGRE